LRWHKQETDGVTNFKKFIAIKSRQHTVVIG
jgi:hypothetical protein